VVALAAAVVLAFAASLAVPRLAVVAVWGGALNLARAVVDFAMAAWLLCLPPGTWVRISTTGSAYCRPARRCGISGTRTAAGRRSHWKPARPTRWGLPPASGS